MQRIPNMESIHSSKSSGGMCCRERGANEVFTGGISSYSVFNMVRGCVVEVMLQCCCAGCVLLLVRWFASRLCWCARVQVRPCGALACVS